MGEAARGVIQDNGSGNGASAGGGAVVVDREVEYRVPAPSTVASPEPGHDGRDLSTRELVSRILQTGSRLVSTQIELARAEVKADIESQIQMAKLLAVAAVGALLGLNLLLVAAAFALAHWMPAWLAALSLGVLVLVVSGVIGYIGWRRRLTRPLEVTRKTVTEDVQWVKERLS
jgi:uncharacterized membrane protein YqjE